MHRLIANGLMFGNLIRVDSPVLVERYNRALKHLIGKTTEVRAFAEYQLFHVAGHSQAIHN